MSDYRIEVLSGAQRLDPHRGNVDVLVHFEDGRRLSATFFTLDSVRERMKAYQKSGECAGGVYFFAENMILIERLSDESIAKAVADLVATGELESAFSLG